MVQYNLTFTPGKLNHQVSNSTVDLNTAGFNTFIAGNSMGFTVTGQDQFGNLIDYSEHNLADFKLYYALKTWGSRSLLYSEVPSEPIMSSDGKNVKWNLPFTKAGYYELFAVYQ